MHTLRVLVLEDSASDAELVIRELRSFGYALEWKRVDSEEDFRAHLAGELDLIIADYALPEFDAARALEILRSERHSTPFIIVTGTITEETAVSVLKKGADDYLLKDRLTRLGNAVQSALQQRQLREERMRAQRALVESEERYRRLVTRMSALVTETDPQGRTVFVNDAVTAVTGYSREDVLGRNWFDLILPADERRKLDAALHENHGSKGLGGYLMQCTAKDGSLRVLEWTSVNLHDADGRLQKIIGLGVDVTQRELASARLQESARRIEELSRRLMVVQEEERRRLAGELHDRTSPNLAAIKLNLEIVGTKFGSEAEELQSRIADTRALLEDATASIREVCADLRPSVLDYAGLLPALKTYAQQFARRTGVAVRVSGPGSMTRLPPERESLLFRIVQEALTNAAKHARATNVEIGLAESGAHAVLTIADDGVGFDPQELGRRGKAPGLGLLTMRERAEFAGGTFVIDSQPGDGTRIRVELENGHSAVSLASRGERT